MSNKSTPKSCLLIFVFALTAFCTIAAGNVIYVDADASGANNGTSWTHAYTLLQDALDIAEDGNDIWVAQGTYYPTRECDDCGAELGDRGKHFRMKDGVGIYGGFPNTGNPGWGDRDPNTCETILSGDLLGNDNPDTSVEHLANDPTRSENCLHVFYDPFAIDIDEDAVLDGFTITGGNANGSLGHWRGGGMSNYQSNQTITNCIFTGNSADRDYLCDGAGGGMHNYNSSPVITNCIFTGNLALTGGGIHNQESSGPIITNCTFSGNLARYPGHVPYGGGGGGMKNSMYSNPTITNCTFSQNTAATIGGGIYNYGSDPTVINCTFTGNTATNFGGGMANFQNVSSSLDSYTIVTNCTFTGNTADVGGGMHNLFFGNPKVTNCTFCGNSATNSGGGMASDENSDPNLTNCTFSGNSAINFGGGMANNENSEPNLTNCTFSGNSAAINGGGMHNYNNSSPMVTNCTFCDNSVTNSGAGMANEDNSDPNLTNCTFSGNSATNSGGGIANDDNSDPNLTNCILWANNATLSGDEIYNNSSVPQIGYCDIAGSGGSGSWNPLLGIDGGGNIDDDPLFVDPDGPDTIAGTEDDNLRLSSGSPCIDAGDNTAVPVGVNTDIGGRPRFIDDPKPDTGNGTPPIVDMGAYERDPFIIYVDSTASGANNGTSWTDAYTLLQDALDIAIDDDQIWVAQGTYYPTTEIGGSPDRYKTFQMKNGVTIKGGYAGCGATDPNERNIQLYETILSGDLDANDTPGLDPCDLLDHPSRQENSYHVVTASYIDANAILDGFTVSGGNANGSGGASSWGAGMFIDSASPTVTNCTFNGNSAAINGGGMQIDFAGGPTVAPTVTNCTFSGNSAYNGGGMCIEFQSSTDTTVTNCTFKGNSADDTGGAICLINGTVTLANCILWGNTAPTGPQMSIHTSSSATVSFNDIQGGQAAIDISGSALNWGSGNIDTDPLFIDADGPDNIVGTEDDNLRLMPDSPCIDAGDNTAVPGTVTTDLDANPRFIDDPNTGDTGNGVPPIVDMGAFEYWPVIYVNSIALGANNGASWTNAFTHLGDALEISTEGQQVWVAEATYYPTTELGGSGDRYKTFRMKNGVEIYGGFPNTGNPGWNDRQPSTYVTTLSGDLDNDDTSGIEPYDLLDHPSRQENSYHVLTASYIDATAILDGFTVSGGNANGSDASSWGAGMFNNSAGPTVTNCTFSGNSAAINGGAMQIDFGAGPTIAPTVTNCTFSGNSAYNGAGMCIEFQSSTDTTVTNCTFSGNSADYVGGAICLINGTVTLANCILWNNTASIGSQMSIHTSSSATVSYSDLEGGQDAVDIGASTLNWGTGNINTDPLFIDADGEDDTFGTEDDNLHLMSYSPCIEVGDPIGDYSGQLDMDGDERLRYDNVDMGSDEVFPIAGDIDWDEDVDFFDLDYFRERWLNTPCVDPGYCDGADINWDGIVNFTDFAYLAQNWMKGI